MDRIELSEDFGRRPRDHRASWRQTRDLRVPMAPDSLIEEAVVAGLPRRGWVEALRALTPSRLFRRRKVSPRRIRRGREKMEKIWETREQGTLPKPSVIHLNLPLEGEEP